MATAWEFLRNDALDAANFFENSGGIPKGEYRQNQFGATLGGPVIKDKTFFFVDYEGLQVRQAIPSVNTVPTALERSSGYTNLSELLTQGGTRTDILGQTTALGQVFDPATTRVVSCGVPDTVTGITVPCQAWPTVRRSDMCATPFPGNIIPANRLDPNAINLLNLYPAPNNSGLFNNYAANPVLRNQSNQFDARGGPELQRFGQPVRPSQLRLDNPQFIPGPFPGIADGGSFAQGNQTAESWNAVLSETHTFSPSLLNEARFGYNRISTTRVQPNDTTTRYSGAIRHSGHSASAL